MGLDLHTASGAHVRVGSYHCVHELRSICCAAFIITTKSTDARDDVASWITLDDGDDAVDRATEYLKAPEWPMPDYKAAGGERNKTGDRAWAGLQKFVSHSDCDGGHTAGDAADICATFQQIEPAIPNDLLDWFREIRAFFEAARDAEEAIEYA